MRVACFSVAAMDFFPQQNASYAGGNSLNQAVRFRQLGHNSTFVGALGTDEAGERIATLLNNEKIDTTVFLAISTRPCISYAIIEKGFENA